MLLGSIHFERVVDGIFKEKTASPSGETICRRADAMLIGFRGTHPLVAGADALLWALRELEQPFLIVGANGGDQQNRDVNTRIGMINALIGDQISMVIGDPQSSKSSLFNPGR